MLFWMQLKWLTLKLNIISVKLSVRRAFIIRRTRLKTKLAKTKQKAKTTRRKTIRAAKDLVLPSLPGVSKLKLPDAPAPHLLSSNLPPADSEIPLLQKAIAQAEVTASKLKTKLAERTQAGQSSRGWETVTRHKIGRTVRFIEQHKGALSLIRRLPCEILQEIFTWATPIERVHSRGWTVSDLPWQLGQVCQSWRASALTMAPLWNHLPVIQLKRSKGRVARQVECLSELLRRSKETPLDVYVYSQSFSGTSHPTIDLLSQHSERWQVVSIESTPAAIAAFQPVKGRLSSLKVLTLHTRARYTDPLPRVDIFEVAPQLQAVSVGGPLPQDLVLPYSQLVHYRERVITTNRINQAVSSALLQSLTFLELSDDIVFPDVTIPKLTKLHVKFHYRARPNCFDGLVLPSIEEIRLVAWGGDLIASLIALVSRAETPCPLKTLNVRAEAIEPGDLTALLRLTPRIESLDCTLPTSCIDIQHLTMRDHWNVPLVAPLLQNCRFYLEDLAGEDMTRALNDFARARCGRSPATMTTDIEEWRPLESLCLYFDGAPWSFVQQAALEGWGEPASVGSAFSVLKTQLILEVPEIVTGRPRSGSKAMSKKWAEKVHAILGGIGRVDIKDPKDIYISSMHLLLKKFAEMKYPVGSDASHLSYRAKEILEAWYPLFFKHLPRRHWAFQGPYAMTYISDDNAIRTGPDALDIVYGLKDEQAFPTIFWPMFMTHS